MDRTRKAGIVTEIIVYVVVIVVLGFMFGYWVLGELILGHFCGRMHLPNDIPAAWRARRGR